jgi:hypothetical protein
MNLLDLDPRRVRTAVRTLRAQKAAQRRIAEQQAAIHAQYRKDPVEWAVRFLGVRRETLVWSLNPGYETHEWDGTPDPLVRIGQALAEWKDVGVESGTSTGKSFWAACLILWFLACWERSRVFTFAPKEDQLKLYIWKEITELWPRFQAIFPNAEKSTLRIRMIPGSDAWGAFGYPVGIEADKETAIRAQGMHAEHMLLIYEEMPGIPLPVIRSGQHTSTGEHNLRLGLGNPDSQQDTLHQFCMQSGVVHIRISALDHPNIVCGKTIVPGGSVSRKHVERERADFGEGSAAFQSRIRGISPRQAADSVIRWEWLEAAAARYNDLSLRVGHRALGADVANSENGDQAALSRWLGACCLEVMVKPCPDANVFGFEIGVEMAANKIQPLHVGVDNVGVGAGAVNELKRLGYYVQALNSGDPPVPEVELGTDEGRSAFGPRETVADATPFRNLRAQMWWQLREDLQYGRIALPYDEKLFRELVTPKWEPKNGKIVVQPKEEIRDLLGRSTDRADAVVYGNWVRQRGHTPQPLREIRAWDRDVLEHEARTLRRVKQPVAAVSQEAPWHPEVGL